MKREFSKKSLLLFVASSLVLFSPGLSDKVWGASPEVKIGSILPLSGDSSPQGVQSKRAQEMAVEEINASGGIKSLGGAKIKLIFSDSQTKPQVAVSEAERLLSQEKVAFLMGAYNSGITLPASEVAERYKKVWFVPVSSDISITKRGFKYVFRLAENSETRVEAQINFIKELEKLSGTKLKNFALVYENTTMGQGNAAVQRKLVLQNGWNIVLDEAYDAKAADMSPVVTKIKAANPEILIVSNSYMPSSIMLAKGLKEQKVEPKGIFATSGSQSDPDYLKNAGEASIGVFDVSAWDPDVNRPHSLETAKKFYSKYGVYLNNEGAKEYVAMYVVKDVLERAGSLDSEKIRDAFASTKITQGIPQMYSKTVRFDQTGTFPGIESMVMVQFQKVGDKVERVTVLPKDSARPGFKPIFPYTPAK
jgi:branched-chain amino acid transport system substrate-binding protein